MPLRYLTKKLVSGVVGGTEKDETGGTAKDEEKMQAGIDMRIQA